MDSDLRNTPNQNQNKARLTKRRFGSVRGRTHDFTPVREAANGSSTPIRRGKTDLKKELEVMQQKLDQAHREKSELKAFKAVAKAHVFTDQKLKQTDMQIQNHHLQQSVGLLKKKLKLLALCVKNFLSVTTGSKTKSTEQIVESEKFKLEVKIKEILEEIPVFQQKKEESKVQVVDLRKQLNSEIQRRKINQDIYKEKIRKLKQENLQLKKKEGIENKKEKQHKQEEKQLGYGEEYKKVQNMVQNVAKNITRKYKELKNILKKKEDQIKIIHLKIEQQREEKQNLKFPAKQELQFEQTVVKQPSFQIKKKIPEKDLQKKVREQNKIIEQLKSSLLKAEKQPYDGQNERLKTQLKNLEKKAQQSYTQCQQLQAILVSFQQEKQNFQQKYQQQHKKCINMQHNLQNEQKLQKQQKQQIEELRGEVRLLSQTSQTYKQQIRELQDQLTQCLQISQVGTLNQTQQQRQTSRKINGVIESLWLGKSLISK